MHILSDKDADLSFLESKIVAVLGYGSQGRAQASMLKDSGVDVVVGLRKNGSSWNKALEEKHTVMTIPEAVRKADIIHILLPDEVQPEVFQEHISPFLASGKTLSFSHGFCITYQCIKPPVYLDVIMVAPIAPGSEERKLYLENHGVPAVIAVFQNVSGTARHVALAMAKAMKFTKTGVLESTFEQETHTDLFGEQVVLCGGLSALVKTGYDILVEAGYPAEMAYFECLHQIELLASLLKKGGISGMWNEISNTAEYGGRKAAPLLITTAIKKNMKFLLKRIENGTFASAFLREYRDGMPNLKEWRKNDKSLSIEKIGKKIRRLFS